MFTSHPHSVSGNYWLTIPFSGIFVLGLSPRSHARKVLWVWRQLPVVTDTSCSSGWPGFVGQHPHRGAQTPVTLVLGDLIPSSSLWEHCTHVVRIHACRQNTHKISINKISCALLLCSLSSSHSPILSWTILKLPFKWLVSQKNKTKNKKKTKKNALIFIHDGVKWP